MALAEFLLARLNEDEVAIRRIWNAHGLTDDQYWMTPASPSRLLNEVAAKRLMLDGHLPAIHRCDGGDFACYHEDCALKTALASVYADHPDYREEWKG